MNETLNFYENCEGGDEEIWRHLVESSQKKQPIEPALAGSLVAREALIFQLSPVKCTHHILLIYQRT